MRIHGGKDQGQFDVVYDNGTKESVNPHHRHANSTHAYTLVPE